MSPVNIVKAALNAGLGIIAITDHNSTKQFPYIKKLGMKQGLKVIGGAEINSFEEVHCITLFETDEAVAEFQNYIDKHLIAMSNDPNYFGYQVVVNELDEIMEYEDRLLVNRLDVGVIEIEKEVHNLNGIFIPAHIDRPFNGMISQLGFIPSELKADAFEITRFAKLADWKCDQRLPANPVFVRNSDAHQLKAIGQAYTFFEMEEATFSEIRKTLNGEGERKIFID